MISHVFIGIRNFEQALSLYTPLMQALDLPLKFCEPEKSWAGWMAKDAPRPLFIIGLAYDGKDSTPGNGQMIALLAANRETVRRCHAIALENGGLCEGAPGLRPHYHPQYYGAYFRDLDGNKLCVCCHDAED
ncbi:MAG: VOC family protein [Undibacterium sp.]|uniref:VOC family protein n=1 Tax=Undibacterium sp. TaxID=1914977 RepID=UPI00271BC374|nr:VOC family protein [Undibacterium sp.]MDO8652498.1 VOC family protein [Undibacterium sp.]